MLGFDSEAFSIGVLDSMAKAKLIPGFRFHPTDVELLRYYLKRKVMGKKFYDDVIAELDIYKYAPWDLPHMSCLKPGDLEWYFFCPRGKKYAIGTRMNRATDVGYWKITGRDKAVQHNHETVGMIKTLVFHKGKAPRGDRTDWIMHEYRLEDKELTDKGIPQDSFVICKVFQKEGPGPRKGILHGRSFNEEDWDDEEVEIPFDALSAPVPILPTTSHISVTDYKYLSASGYIGSTSISGSSIPSPDLPNPSDPSDQAVDSDDDFLSMLHLLKENNSLPEVCNLSSSCLCLLLGNVVMFVFLSIACFRCSLCS